MGCGTLSGNESVRWARNIGSISATKSDADAKSVPSTLLQIHPLLLS
jgi:hypothetical protein